MPCEWQDYMPGTKCPYCEDEEWTHAELAALRRVAEAAEKWLKAREGIAATKNSYPDGFGQWLTASMDEADAAKALEDAVRDRRQSQAQK